MLKNITFSAENNLIRKAREKARQQQVTLNKIFRHWLTNYVQSDARYDRFDDLMSDLTYVKPGTKFSRDELNER